MKSRTMQGYRLNIERPDRIASNIPSLTQEGKSMCQFGAPPMPFGLITWLFWLTTRLASFQSIPVMLELAVTI